VPGGGALPDIAIDLKGFEDGYISEPFLVL